MSGKAVKLVWRMVLATMVLEKERTWRLYEAYIKNKYLHVSIKEILEHKRRETA